MSKEELAGKQGFRAVQGGVKAGSPGIGWVPLGGQAYGEVWRAGGQLHTGNFAANMPFGVQRAGTAKPSVHPHGTTLPIATGCQLTSSTSTAGAR